MFRIAVCGGEPHELEWLRSLLDKYIESHNDTDIKAFFFDTGDELLQDIESGGTYDLYILDVFAPSLTGIELARKIRETDAEIPIVFIAHSADYAYNAFRVSAAQYFLKPVPEADLFLVLDKILIDWRRSGNEIFLFPASDSIVKVLFSDIEHIEIYDHKITAHLVSGNDMVSKTIRTPFADAIAPLLADSRFLQIHRSFTINMEHVREMTGNAFVMTNGSVIPIPKNRLNSARDGYSKWMLQHGISIPADKRVKTGKTARRTTAVSLIVLLILTAILNLSPGLSAAAYEIPVIGDIVRVLTFNRFAYEDKGYSAEVNLPQIRGLLDAELEERLNAEFREYADDLILSFEDAIIEIAELGVDVEETSGEPAHMSIMADYTVKTDNDRVLAIDAYLYSETNGLELHKFWTVDKQTHTQITLESLFKPDADYITPISAYILGEMERLNRDGGAAYNVGDGAFAGFTSIRPDHSFYIDSDGKLVICFDKYEVAAGFMGAPEFVIPIEVIADIVSTDLIR